MCLPFFILINYQYYFRVFMKITAKIWITNANKTNKHAKLFFLKMLIVQLQAHSLYHSLMLSHACLMEQADCRVSLSSAGPSVTHHDRLSLGRIARRLLKHA